MNFRLSYEYFICSVILAEIESSRIYWGVFVHFKSFQTQFCLIHRSSSSSSSYKLAFYYICLPPLHVNVFTYKLQFLVLLLKFSCYVQPSKCFILFISSQLAVVQLAHVELIPSISEEFGFKLLRLNTITLYQE